MDETTSTTAATRYAFDKRISTYVICMAILAFISFINFFLITFVPLPGPIEEVLRICDFVVGLIFLAAFVCRFIRAPSKWTYMRTWGWLDLLSGVPLPFFSIARMAWVVRVALTLRKMGLKDVESSITRHPARSALTATGFLALLVIVSSSAIELAVEKGDSHHNIRTGGDALWWAMTTITTVGYGDTYPVTDWGRITAAIVMAVGVVIFGVLSSYLAATFISSREGQDKEAIIAALKADLDTLKTDMAEIKQLLQQRD